MTIYNYNNEFYEITISTEARENPLEKGKYLLPANATTKAPLSAKDGFTVCFNEELDKWEYKEDFRGQDIYNEETKENSICDYLGVIKNGFVLGKYIEPEKPKTEEEIIAEYKSYYLEKFNAKLDELDYDDIATVGVWAIKTGSTFQAEAKALLNWYEAIINKNYEILNAVKKGDREMPSKEEYLAELPLYTTYEI